MDAKALVALLITINLYSSCGAALRRTPKVYNALITTDENLTSSRAYPVIQPTIHENGAPAHYPFGPYNPYGFYSPPIVRFGQPIAPGLSTRGPLLYPYPQAPFPPQMLPQPSNGPPQGIPPSNELNPGDQSVAGQLPSQQPAPGEEQQPVKPPAPGSQAQASNYGPIDESQPQQMPNEKLPIPLNEYGFPPALIPLQQQTNHNRPPINLSPYDYNQYPLVYDPITGAREQYLPPYEYFPSPNMYAFRGGAPTRNKPQAAPQPTLTQTPSRQTTTTEAPEDNETTANSFGTTITTPSFESIKNGSKSENSDVPDVPPPPIPSGAKSKQS